GGEVVLGSLRADKNAAQEAPRPARTVDLGASCIYSLACSIGRSGVEHKPDHREREGKSPIMSTTTPASSTSNGPPDANRVRIFDTTLRDGEQSPGASMNIAEKLEMARALAALGVDIIEAGFPIASVGDFEAVRAIAAEVTGSLVCGLARCNERDI